LCAWFHAIGLFYFAVFVLWLLYHRKWSITAVSTLLTLPCVALAITQSRDVSDGFWLQLTGPFWHIIKMTVTTGTVYPLHTILTFTPVFALTTIGLWRYRRWFVEKPLFTAMVLLPFGVWAISILWHPLYLARTLFTPTLLLVMLWCV